MPYQRKSTRKKTGHSRPGYVRCGKMVISDASKALSLAKYLKTIVNVERKNHDVSQLALAMTTTPIIIQLTNILQGDTTVTRDGSQCKILSIEFSYFIIQHVSALDTQTRVMLVLDKQTNQAIYVPGDVLVDVTAGQNINSSRNLDNTRRFSVLYDKVHTLVNTGTSSFHRRFNKSVQYLIRFDNAAAAITSLTQSSLSMMIMSNEGTNTPDLSFRVRLRFVDN